MSPHHTLKGEGSRQRRPGAGELHPARGCGGAQGCSRPRQKTPLSRAQEQLWRRNGERHPREPRGAGAAGPAGPAPPAGEPRAEPGEPQGAQGRGREGMRGLPGAALTVDVLPVADVLQVAARVLPAQLGLGAVGLQPRVGIPAQLGAGGDAAGRGVPHLLCPAPARPGSGGGEGRPVSGGGGKPWAAAATRGSGGGGGGGGCGALRLHSPAVPPGGSSAEAAPQRGRRSGLRQLSRPRPRAGSAGPAGAQPHPPPPPRSRRARSAHAPTRQRRSLRASDTAAAAAAAAAAAPGGPREPVPVQAGGDASRRAGCGALLGRRAAPAATG